MRIRRFKARRQHRVAAIERLESRCLLTGPGDVIGDNLAGAFNVGLLVAEEPRQFLSAIDADGDLDVFQFQAGSDGPATFQLNAVASATAPLDTIVTLLDSSGVILASNDDISRRVKDSSLTYVVHAGETYYVVSSGFRSSTGGYSLSISLPTVVDLNVLVAFQPPIQSSGTIEVAGDHDAFQFVAASSGLTVIQLDAANSNSLDTLVTLLDSDGPVIESDDDNGLGLNSYLTYSLTAGRTYYIDASGVGASMGDYTLLLSQPTVTNLGMLSVANPLMQPGSVGVSRESDFYSFQAQANGFAMVGLSASQSPGLDPIVTVLDPDGAFLTFNDDIDFPINTNSSLTFGVMAGQTYFVQAEGFRSSTGDYLLTVSQPMIADLGMLTSIQSRQVNGDIGNVGESDFYQIQANADGLLVLELDPTQPQTLDTIVTLRDSSGDVVATNDDVHFPTQTNSRLIFSVSAEETFFIEASGFGISTGGYRLNATLMTDQVGDTIQQATDIGTLSSVSPLSFASAIESPRDRDIFRFHVDAASLVDIQLTALDSQTLDTVLAVLDSSGMPVAFNDDIDFPSDTNSRLSFSAQANQTFFIDVTGFRDGIGFYTLSATVISAQRVIPIAFPTPIAPTQVTGSIEAVGAISQFRLSPVGPTNQFVRVEVNAVDASLDPVVTVRVLSATDVVTSTVFDDDSGPGRNSLLSVPVAPGQILEVDVRGFGLSTGAFTLIVSTTAAAADNVAMLNNDLTNSDLRPGRISQPYERDVFRFTAASTGQVILDLVARDRLLDPVLTVVNSAGVVVGFNDDSPFNLPLSSNRIISAANVPVTSLNSHLEINVMAGMTYDIIVRDFAFQVGSYFLVATQAAQVDDFADSFEALDTLRRTVTDRAFELTGRHELPATVAGQISAATASRGTQDVDLLDFQANFTGVLDLIVSRDPGLGVAMSVFRDIRRTGAGSGDYELVDVLPPGATTLSIPVDEFGVYVVRIVGLSGAGGYRLSGGEHADEVPDSISNAPTIELSAAPMASLINFAADRDVYRFVGPPSGGLVSVSLSQTAGSRLDPLLTILDDKGEPIASNDDVNFLANRIDSLVTFQADAGVVYYVQAAGIGSTTGGYRLSVAPANGQAETDRSVGNSGDSNAERAFLEAATTGLVSIANGAGMNGDRNATAIRNAVVEAIATLAKQGKLTSNYLVLILDDAPEAGFVLTDGQGMTTAVSPGSGVTQLPSGGIVNTGQFAVVAIVPTTGVGVPTLQISGFGSNLGSSFQASMVTRSGASQSLTQQQISRSGSTSDGKVQLTFALGFEAIANRSVPAGQTPSFFLATNAFLNGTNRIDEVGDSSVALANIDIDENLRTTLSFNPLDPEAWQGLFEGVLQSLQLEGLPRTSLGEAWNRVRVSEESVPAEVLMKSPVVRSAKAVYEVLKQGADWIGHGPRKMPASNPKPRVSTPKVTQETPFPKNPRQAKSAPRKMTPLGG